MMHKHVAIVFVALTILGTSPIQAADGSPEELSSAATRAFQRGDKEAAIKLADQALAAAPNQPGLYQQRGSMHFRTGHIVESLADFDKFLELRPDERPQHWQRGIALYYAKKYEEGQKQFELHQTVNPNDVENAVWHYLCVARKSDVAQARKSLIKIEGDRRVPMMQVYAMFAGRAKPEDVLAAARAGEPEGKELNQRLFYAHLYIGLYNEAAGKAEAAREHIELAATKYAGQDYMSDVARVHLQLMKKD
jgi:lipoprotein NlpI